MSGYTRVEKKHAQVELIADRIVEPKTDQVVSLLDALPPWRRSFMRRKRIVFKHVASR